MDVAESGNGYYTEHSDQAKGNASQNNESRDNNIMNLSNVAFFCAHDENGRRRRVNGKPLSDATYKSAYRSCVARLTELFGDCPVHEIASDDLIDWQEWLDGRDINAVTRNTYVRTAKALWRHMKQRGVPVCDTEGVFQFVHEQKGVKSITTAHAYTMLAHSGLRDATILWLAMVSVRRRGGLARLRVENMRIFLDEDSNEYRMIGSTTEKGEKPQVVFADHNATMLLQTWLDVRDHLLKALKASDHGYVFINIKTGIPLTPGAMTAIVN